jgi:hypothetical protein
MKLFGGDIICESKVGEWTKFSLFFPVVEDGKEKCERNFGDQVCLEAQNGLYRD